MDVNMRGNRKSKRYGCMITCGKNAPSLLTFTRRGGFPAKVNINEIWDFHFVGIGRIDTCSSNLQLR